MDIESGREADMKYTYIFAIKLPVHRVWIH